MDRREFLKTVGIATAGSLVPVSYAFGGPNWFTSAQTVSSVSTSSNMINVQDFGAIGDGVTDDGPAIQAAIDSLNVGAGKNPGTVFFPIGKYRVTLTLKVADGLTLVGESGQDVIGAEIQYHVDSANPLITQSDISRQLSYFQIKNMAFRNTILSPGTKGNGGDCFRFWGLTNNSKIQNVIVRNFGGSAFHITKFIGGVDHNAIFNAHFDQCFVVSCGEFGWELDDLITGLWTHCDVNSCAEGFVKFSNNNKNKAGNQEMATFVGCLWEGGRVWASNYVYLTENAQGMPLNLIGCSNFSRSGTAVIKMDNTSIAHVTAIGCTEANFTNFIEDNVNSETIDIDNGGSYLYETNTRRMKIIGTYPTLDFIDTNGTIDNRAFKFQGAVDSLICTTRFDNGTQDKEVYRIAHNTAEITFAGDVQIGSSIGPTIRSGTGRPNKVVTGAVGDLYLQTNGGAGTTLWVKESGTGKNGWVGK